MKLTQRPKPPRDKEPLKQSVGNLDRLLIEMFDLNQSITNNRWERKQVSHSLINTN